MRAGHVRFCLAAEYALLWRVEAIGFQSSLCGGKMILENIEWRDVPALHDAAVDPYFMRIEDEVLCLVWTYTRIGSRRATA
ncbi:hypothetical protein XH96_32640 [Bradyrhizobium sp. CCBAU 51765]|nr:hypothetical protein XH96_32640 [Bradyrhizobium sp. CCBAU 51765]